MEYGRITVYAILTYTIRHLTNITTLYDISISNPLKNSLRSNFKFIMLKKVSMGQNKDNMLINDLTVVAVIRKFDGVAM